MAHVRTKIEDALTHLEKLAEEGLEDPQLSHLADAQRHLEEAKTWLESVSKSLGLGNGGGAG